MSREHGPRIVAELGRPETADETAARKAETSRTHRANQTFLNLALALVASLVVVLVTVLVVVRPDPPAAPPVDYRAIASEAGASVPLAIPDLPATWKANSAVFDETPADGVATWYIGFITPDQQFIGVRQGIGANPTWLSNQVGNRSATGSTRIDGLDWQLFDHRDAKDAGNLAYAMTASISGSDFVLFGTASPHDFDVLAASLSHDIQSKTGNG
ncbi:MAG: DUF4245 domain-containing protein [Cryobacterium sp.]|nr:DUF4245 domain-containing protein [Cryobacterium sp.]